MRGVRSFKWLGVSTRRLLLTTGRAFPPSPPRAELDEPPHPRARTARVDPRSGRSRQAWKLLTSLLLSGAARAQSADHTLAPYFFVDGGLDPANAGVTDVLPLKRSQVHVEISGAIAEVRVSQVYRNEGQRTLEAMYFFPASSRAAVHGVKMTIGKRVIEARIGEKEAARKDYEKAKSEGRAASLLEQKRPNVFQMNVANILPGEQIDVELRYAELLVPNAHVYEFVYPTTIGPRYSRTKASAASSDENYVEAAYLPAKTPAAHTFALDGYITAPVPVRAVSSPSHASARFDAPSPTRPDRGVGVKLAESDEAGNRDFILRYALEGDAIAGGLLLQPSGGGSDDNHFLLMLQPPARVPASVIVPREYVFVVDVSGSMIGFPLETTKALMRRLLDGLRREDRFNILSFSGGHALLAPTSLSATPENIAVAQRYLEGWIGGGGTELLAALRQGFELPRVGGLSRSLLVVTDGFVNVERESFELIEGALGTANLFAFGIGSSVNRFLIEGMAHAGGGEPFIVTDPAQAQSTAAAFQRYIESPVLREVRARFEGFETFAVEPPALPDLFAERPILLQGKYRGAPTGSVVLSGRAAGTVFEQTIDVAGAPRLGPGGALGLLWARTRITRLSDLDSAGTGGIGIGERSKAEVLALGLKHALLTAYTSFIAVDTIVRADGTSVSVQHPQPMPAGVGNEALGATMGGLGTIGSGAGGGGTGYGVGLGSLGTIAGRRASAFPDIDVRPATATVKGAMDPELVRRIVRRHINEVRFRYEQALGRNPALTGTIIITFTVGADGTVLSSKIESSTLGDPELERAISSAVLRWEFLRPTNGKPVIITYPFALSRSAAP